MVSLLFVGFRLFDESVPVFDLVPFTHVAGLGVRSSFRWTKRHPLPALHWWLLVTYAAWMMPEVAIVVIQTLPFLVI